MSDQQQLNSHAVTGVPACPQCGRQMSMRTVSPVLFAPDVDDVVYGCAGCNTETKRSVKRD